MSVEEGLKALRHLPYEDLGFAKVDTHRAIRRGMPEVVFGQGKTPEQVAAIVESLVRAGQLAVVTRAQQAHYEAVRARRPEAVFREQARIILSGPPPEPAEGLSVCILSGGTADLPVAEEAAVTLEALGVRSKKMYDVGVAGIHRLLSHLDAFSDAGAAVVVAGMEGALPSVVAGLVDVPVVAVPTSVGYGASFSGLAPLLAMLNSCAVGVAVMNIDNGFGAACFAALIVRSGRSARSSPQSSP
jgi:hypothetical protein